MAHQLMSGCLSPLKSSVTTTNVNSFSLSLKKKTIKLTEPILWLMTNGRSKNSKSSMGSHLVPIPLELSSAICWSKGDPW